MRWMMNLWKAYFRGHAEFITVDQAILDANEQREPWSLISPSRCSW